MVHTHTQGCVITLQGGNMCQSCNIVITLPPLSLSLSLGPFFRATADQRFHVNAKGFMSTPERSRVMMKVRSCSLVAVTDNYKGMASLNILWNCLSIDHDLQV